MNNRKQHTRRLLLALGLAALLLGAAVRAQTGAYDISWSTVDNGGGTASAGAYALTNTIGQPDAGKATGGLFTLGGGFWNDNVTAIRYGVNIPLLVR